MSNGEVEGIKKHAGRINNFRQAAIDRTDDALAKIDTLITKAERFIELAKERRSPLITAEVTGQIEVPAASDPSSIVRNVK